MSYSMSTRRHVLKKVSEIEFRHLSAANAIHLRNLIDIATEDVNQLDKALTGKPCELIPGIHTWCTDTAPRDPVPAPIANRVPSNYPGSDRILQALGDALAMLHVYAIERTENPSTNGQARSVIRDLRALQHDIIESFIVKDVEKDIQRGGFVIEPVDFATIEQRINRALSRLDEITTNNALGRGMIEDRVRKARTDLTLARDGIEIGRQESAPKTAVPAQPTFAEEGLHKIPRRVHDLEQRMQEMVENYADLARKHAAVLQDVEAIREDTREMFKASDRLIIEAQNAVGGLRTAHNEHVQKAGRVYATNKRLNDVHEALDERIGTINARLDRIVNMTKAALEI